MRSTTTSFIEGLQNSRADSLDKFKRLYVPTIFKLCVDVCDDAASAEQITAEIVQVIFKRMKNFTRQDGKKFRNYIKTITFSKIKGYARKVHSQKKRWERQNFTAQFDAFMLRRTIADLKRSKSIHQQSWDMFHLHYEQKMSVETVSEKFGLAVDSVKRTLRRIRNEIRKALDA